METDNPAATDALSPDFKRFHAQYQYPSYQVAGVTDVVTTYTRILHMSGT